MQKCSKCQELKSLDSFHKSNQHPNGYRQICKLCRKPYSQFFYQKNQKQIINYQAGVRRRKPHKNKKYYQANKQYFESYRSENKPRYSLWRRNNRKKLNDYRRHKIKTDPQFKLSCSLRSRLSTLLKQSRAKKYNTTLELLGCSLNEFKNYIEKQFQTGMSWDNYGNWHIDHVRPCSSFDLTKEQDQKLCFRYSNLQPLWAKDNLVKSSSYQCPLS